MGSEDFHSSAQARDGGGKGYWGSKGGRRIKRCLSKVRRLGPDVHGWNPLGEKKVGALLNKKEVVAEPTIVPV